MVFNRLSVLGTALLAPNASMVTLSATMKALSIDQNVLLIQTQKLNIAQASQALIAAGVSREERIQILTKAGLINATNSQTGANVGLTASLKGVTTALLAQAKAWLATPLGMATIAIVGTFALVKAVDAFTVSLEESRENLAELKQEYTDNESKLSSLNNELETTSKRIAELESKEKLTFTEKEELDNLKKQNNELDRQIHLLELQQKIRNQSINKTFVDTMNKDLNVGEMKVMGQQTNITEKQEIEGQFSIYKSNLDKIAELDEKYKDDLSNKQYIKERKRIEDRNNKIKEYLSGKEQEFAEVAEGISYISNPTTKDEKAVNTWLDYIYDFQDKMAIALGGDNAKTDAFNRLVDTTFSEVTGNLKTLGEQGEVTAKMLQEEKYKPFIDKLIQIGFITKDDTNGLNDIALAFNSFATATTDSGVTNGLSKISEAVDKIVDRLTLLNDKSSLLADIKKEIDDTNSISGDSLKEIADNFDGLDSAIADYLTGIKTSKELYAEIEKAYEKDSEAYKKSLLAKMQNNEDFYNNLNQAKKIEIDNASKAYGIDLQNFKTLEKKKLEFQSQIIKSLAQNYAKYNNYSLSMLQNAAYGLSKAINWSKPEGYTSTIEELKAVQDAINKIKAYNDQIDSIALDAISVDFDSFSSSSSSSSSSSTKEASKGIVDWIEIAIEHAKSVVSSAQQVFENTFKTITSRLSASKDEIKAINKELSIQEKAYKRYMQEANSVGLSDSLAEKVRNGDINIKEYDSETQDLIESYQEWYEKSQACKEAIDELNVSLTELYKMKFDTIASYFDNTLSAIAHTKNMIDEEITQAEARGHLLSENYYKALIKNEKDNISELKEERESLIAALAEAESNGIAKYSDDWYEMKSQIDDITLSIEQSTTTMIEYNNAIRDIEWQTFDMLQNRIAQITKESEFLAELLSSSKLYDDKGQLTSEGLSTMGLHGLNYNVYMEQANKYAEELLRIEGKLRSNPYDQELLERREELVELQRESILAAEDEKQAIVDMVKEGIDLELESLQDLIDTYKDALESQKDLYSYQKKISEQTKNIATLEKQLSAYSGFNDEETKAKVQQIKVSLEEARSDLEETEYDRMISETNAILDSLYDEYELILNERLDNIDALITDMIEEINSGAGEISETLKELSKSVGYDLSDVMNYIWDDNFHSATNVLSAYNQNTNAVTVINDTLRILNSQLQEMLDFLDTNANKGLNSTNSRAVGNAIIRKSNGEVLIPLTYSDFYPMNNVHNSIWNMSSNPSSLIRDNLGMNKFNVPIAQGNNNVYSQHFDKVVFSMPNVRNYEETLKSLQNDKNFERLIQAMTSDLYMGKSPLAKGKAIRNL